MRAQTRFFSVLAVLVPALGTLALAEGPENAVLIVDASSPEALYISNYYADARGIPARNVVYMRPGADDLAAFAGANRDGLLGALANRSIGDHADMVILPPGSPFYVSADDLITDPCFDIRRLSISSAYAATFFLDEILAGTSMNLPLGYFSATGDALAFDSEVFYFGGHQSDSDSAHRYFIGAMLGQTGAEGNTLDEIIAMIDRSVAADGTRPEGTFYFMNNTNDPARNVRHVQFPSVIADMLALGHDAVQIDGVKFPLGHHDCLGVMTGFATANIEGANFTLIDGAFADHLTSYAAGLDVDGQTKVSSWIRKGASASAGTVEEPCNYPGKFNFARLHLYYAEGMSIGEAYLRSLAWGPFQNLLYGDPLTRAHAYIPDVSIPDLPNGPVSGVLTLTPEATTTHPDGDIESLALFIDGEAVGEIAPGGTFTIDTTELDDGYHEFRVVATDDTPVASTGNLVAEIEIANAGGAVTLGASPLSGNLSTSFTFTIDDFEGRTVDRVRLIHNDRVVGSASAAGGAAHVDVYGQTLGAGPVRVRAEAVLASGEVVRTNAIDLEIAFESAPPSGQAPVAFDSHISVLGHQPFVVQLPATFDDALADATYTILDAPDHASVYGGPGPSRVMVAQADGADTDAFTFHVTTPSGTSNIATVSITYLGQCEADVNGDGALNILDFIAFQTLFQNGDDDADVNGDGVLNILDFIEFQSIFAAGCE